MGWDIQPGKSTSPRYEAGDTITVNRNMKLYAVVFNRSDEEDLTASELLASQRLEDWKWQQRRGYSHIIFVGDSRTVTYGAYSAKSSVQDSESNIMRDIDFVCQEGKGLDWLKSDGNPVRFFLLAEE